MSDIEKRLFMLEAKDEIRQKLYAYARSDDRQNSKLGKSVFTKNAYVDYGTSPERGVIYKGNGQKWIEKNEKVDQTISKIPGYYLHFIGNITINVKGHKAGSEAYCLCPVMMKNKEGKWQTMISWARYCDSWIHEDGQWLINKRIVTNDLGFSFVPDSLISPYGSKMNQDDPSYQSLNFK